jgi:VanZ family protein
MAVFAFLPPSVPSRVRWWHAILMSLTLGVLTEALQLVVGRGPSLLDLGVDVAGGFIGWRLGLALVPARMAARRERNFSP